GRRADRPCGEPQDRRGARPHRAAPDPAPRGRLSPLMHAGVRSPLLRKYVRVLLALVGGTLMLSGLAELYFSYRQAQQAIVDVEQAHATAAASRIEQFLSEVQEQVRDTTRTASDDPSAGPLGAAALGFRGGLAASVDAKRAPRFHPALRARCV